MNDRNRVYVMETYCGGAWRVWSAHTTRSEAWKAMREARAQWPLESFRTLAYDSPVTR